MCFLSDNIYDYYNVSQGKITIPNMDDGEEFTLTDVSFMYWTYLFWSTMHRVIFVYPRTQNQYGVSSFVFTHTPNRSTIFNNWQNNYFSFGNETATLER